jgi:sulfide dehydrogenase cytochrome subunit
MHSGVVRTDDALAAASTPSAMLAASCSGCHSLSRSASASIPNLQKLSATQIKTALLAFRSGNNAATVMNRIARGYSDAQIDLLATYLARQ